MSETEFFKQLFPPEDEVIDIKNIKLDIVHDLEYWDKPRTKKEGPVCECVGENTNKALFLYFQKLINKGINLPIYVNSQNEVMDGWHRLHAYHYLGKTKIPIYRNKLWRNHGFCWKKGLEGKRRLRLKTW
jgi:hypothetical protein|tara:strand:+ start:29 stop:418 length:390 start_codon:yes stop_codon:yes gene_type:complete